LAVAAGAVWIDVPFFPQGKDGCGAAAIAMVIEYWAPGTADPAAVLRELPRAPGGVRAGEMIRYLREKGYRTFAFRGEWRDLASHVARGRPLVVCLEEGAGALHYVVVAGIDGDLALVNDPARRKLLKVDRASFEARWKDRWTLLALPQ
jgi:predicted double-glycine peptidase